MRATLFCQEACPCVRFSVTQTAVLGKSCVKAEVCDTAIAVLPEEWYLAPQTFWAAATLIGSRLICNRDVSFEIAVI